MRLNKYQYLENKETYLLIVFFIFSFFIRIPIIFLYGDTSLENEWYLLVNSLAEHGTLSMKNFGDLFVPNLFMPPLYPYYLYFFKIFNFNNEIYIQAVLLSQAMLSSISVIIFYLINKIFFSKKISLLSAVIFSLFPLHIYACGQISSAILQSFLTIVFLYFFFKIVKKSNFKNICFLSIASGLLILLRGEFFAFFILSILYLKVFLKVNTKNILGIILITTIVISPYLVRNIIQLNTFTITKSVGWNLWKGNNPKAGVEGNSDYDTNLYLKEQVSNVNRDIYYDINVDNIFLKEALKNIKSEPGHYLNLYFKKILSYMLIDLKSSYPNYYHPLHYLPNLLFGLLSIIGVTLSNKNSYKMNFLIFLLIFNLAIVSVFFILPRYKLAILPLQIIFTNIFVVRIKNIFFKQNERIN